MEGSVHRFRVQRGNAPAQPDTKEQRNQGSAVGAPHGPAHARRSSTLPACRRCRQQKKRCTRTAEGPCKPCLAAWLPCSLMERDVSPHSRERELRSRIDWLSQLVNQTLPAGGPQIESIETGRGLSLGSSGTQSPSVDPVEEMETDETVRGESQFSTKLEDDDKAISVSGGRRCLQAYFRHVHRAYPFSDSEVVQQDFETLCKQQAENDFLPRSTVPSRLHMLMAIGYTTLQRAGEAQNMEERPFEPCLKTVFCECVSQVNEDSAGTLLLLGLYLLFKPNDLDPRSIVGVLTRHALATGLVSETVNIQKLSPRALELRRRLSWSIYVFDRMIGISYGLPSGIPNDTMQVPLPSIMIHEYGSPEGHQYTIALQVSRHVIALRQLETIIVNSIYQKGTPVHTQELRRQIEDWYTQGCLLSSSALWEQDQVPFHTTITWLNVRYQNLLLLLYTPARANSAAEDSLTQLQAAAQQYIQLSLILHEHRHLPMNWVTLCRLLSLAAIFLYCVAQWSPTFPEIPEITLLASLLELFDPSWVPAHEAARIMRRKSSTSSVITSPGLEVELGLQAIQDELAGLLSNTLGEASFYIWPLRAKVSDRRLSHQLVAMEGMSGMPDGQFGSRISMHNSAFTPADNALTNSPLETQWMSLLGGLGSDML
ncbi:uncharacterized protein N7503_007320 [Penicillium pulvis]|uniref:uncharacterized protein n=1 Tax=Penicillium pulvis TaxID=1562058 RepID=UPI002547F799|nr:uncharacterized protein N7503_007320 [Penicillium pulvis]KAJ5798024.1 hypothetical protein N7503_007320 [Penicillium pulvis]